ncbi:MAG TPA: hypothetical protein VHA56_13745 [Mucilaginibacter sp.]|nr:hypothetical protein [Mucilaginibacter sp.]
MKALETNLPAFTFNFDLDDCDRILRVQGDGCTNLSLEIIRIVQGHAVEISLFED